MFSKIFFLNARFQPNWDSEGEPARPIVVHYSDPDITVRYREQYRNLSKPVKLSETDSRGPNQAHHKSDGDLFKNISPLEISPIDFSPNIDNSDAEKLDDAKRLSISEKNDKNDDTSVLAQIDDWINQVEQKQAKLGGRPIEESKSDNGKLPVYFDL